MGRFLRSGKLKFSKGYKYQCRENFWIDIGIIGYEIDIKFAVLNKNGRLFINDGYAWDGASGPTIDTLNSIIGSVVHDVLYQFIRLSLLPISYKNTADNLLKYICIDDGMFKFRASIWYNGVYYGAGFAIDPKNERKIYEAP